jgi:hypothetical protein
LIAGERRFGEWFAEFGDQLVLIGGVGPAAVMQEA